METTICLFEDEAVNQLEPLTQLHASWDLLVGTGSLVQLVGQAYPKSKVIFSARAYLKDLYAETDLALLAQLPAGPCLFVNGRVLDPWQLAEQITLQGESASFWKGNDLVAVRLDRPVDRSISTEAKSSADSDTSDTSDMSDVYEWLNKIAQTLPKQSVTVPLAHYIWDFVYANPNRILADTEHLHLGADQSDSDDRATLLVPENMILGEGTTIAPGVVLDATNGPIVIGSDASIGANSVIIGPVYLGDKVVVNPLTLINPGTSLGHTCKVGGEISQSIMLPFSNKQHYGFLGHSYIGSWCNLGGGTSTSNMKNTYGTVSVPVGGQSIDTKQPFAGLFMADHAKSGSGTVFNPGTTVGVFSNIFGAGKPITTIAPFSWYDTAVEPATYDLDKALTVAQRAMARRHQPLSESLISAIRSFHKLQGTKQV